MAKANKTKKKEFSFDLGLFLLVTGALANITIWIGAFVATESQGFIGDWVRINLLPVLGGISGLAMGITVTVGLVYVISRLSNLKPTIERKVRGKKKYQSMPNVRFYGAWASIAMLMIISPALLAPYIFMTISGASSLYGVLGETWARVWSVGRIVAADLALSAIALVHGVHILPVAKVAREPKSTTTTTESDATASTTPASAPETASTPIAAAGGAANLRKCDVPGCDIPYKWPQGKGAHFKKHHPDLVIQKGIPVQSFTTTKAEKNS